MPPFKKKWNKNKRYKKSYKNKSYKKRFNDKAINTKIEAKILAIAQSEDRKNRNNLILREYWFATGFLPDYNRLGAGVEVPYLGIVEKIATIDKVDINSPVNAPANDVNPNLYIEIGDVADPDGAQQGMITQPINGRRFTDQVKITGFTLGAKIYQRSIQVVNMYDDNESDDTIHDEDPDQPPNVLSRIANIEIKYSIVGVLRAESAVGTAPNPFARQLIPWNRWGYSRNLDDADRQAEEWFDKKRTFISGTVKYSVKEPMQLERNFTRYVQLKEPLTVLYLPADQNGQQSRNWEFFVVWRSNVPNTDGTQTEDYTPYLPQVTFYTKTHYFE